MSNELLTKGCKLSYKENGGTSSQQFTEATGLRSFPDLGATPDKVEVTNLSDGVRRYIDGLVDYGDLEFGFYYEKGKTGNYAILNALKGKLCDFEFELPDKTKFAWSAYPTCILTGNDVGNPMEFNLSMSVQSEIVPTMAP